MSPPGRPKGEYRRAQPDGSPISPPGRPKGEYRRAPPEGPSVARGAAVAMGARLSGGMLSALLLLSGCTQPPPAPAPALPAADAARAAGIASLSPAERQAILRHGPWPPPPAQDPGNAVAGQPAAIALGRQLFSDPRLSKDGLISCASCHLPGRQFTDGRARSLGREPLDRHTPSLWNVVHQRWYGWDGAADSLWSQALRPLLDPREMASSATHVSRQVSQDATLASAYRQVFGSPQQHAEEEVLVNTAKALGAYTGSLVSGRTPFDEFRDALARNDERAAARYPADALRGLRLFVGKAACTVCHAGPMFTHGEFGDIGLPFFVRPGVVDPGRQGGIEALRASRYHLLSRWSDAAPGDPATLKVRQLQPQHRNFGEFKVPGLRQVAATAPYMHDGQLPTLEAVIRHYSELDLDRLHADGDQILRPLGLSAAEQADLVAFLHSLSADGPIP